MADKSELLAWLRWVLTPGLDNRTFYTLLARVGEVARLWAADRRELEALGVSPEALAAIRRSQPRVSPEQVLAETERLGFACVTLSDPAYPALLRRERYPPPVLWVWGRLSPHDGAAAAVVGTRRPSTTGLALARSTAEFLARMGFTVVSGLAMGIDGAAHRAALAAGGRTLAVVAGGLDRITPRAHQRLAEEAARRGAVISEVPPGTEPRPERFPVRNRLIAGLSLVTIVVEAGEKSGALITAGFAADRGQAVLVYPGDPLRAQTQGTNRLLLEGATPLPRPEDLGWLLPLCLDPQGRRQVQEALAGWAGREEAGREEPTGGPPSGGPLRPASGRLPSGEGPAPSGGGLPSSGGKLPPPAGGLADRVLAVLDGPLSADQLAERVGEPVGRVAAALLRLQLEGRVDPVAGGLFLRRPPLAASSPASLYNPRGRHL